MSETAAIPGHRSPILNVPWPVTVLVAVLVVIHLARWLSGEDIYLWSLAVFAFVPAQLTGGWQPSLPGAQAWSFLSHAFIHGDWMHLLFNSLWLVVFGSLVARRLGPARFLIHAALGAAAGALATLLVHWGETIFLIGASGAVSGQLAAAIPLIYGDGLRPGAAMHADLRRVTPLSLLELLKNRRALMFIAIWFAITLFTGVTGMVAPGETQVIAWEAHVGGFLAGLVGFYLLDRRTLDN
jgi:membrane associated rhomboid family serine protease